MSKHDPKIILRQVMEYARHAEEICAQNSFQDLIADWQKRAAFERVMEVLGEAVKRLPADLCQQYPVVPWKLVAGMRDRISHGYDSIDYSILWDTVRDDVPLLVATVEQMLVDLENPPAK